VDALQEMRNHFDEQLNQGMKLLAQKQGTGGLPAAPDTSTTASDVPPPQPDTTVAKALNDQEAAADRTEAQTKRETPDTLGDGGQVIRQDQQETSLGDIARQVRAQKQQAQAESDPSQAQEPAGKAQDDQK
jgi:cell pole-organizing protein PopZ